MAIRERLVYAIDIVTDGANKGLKNFRTAVGQAEGATGKFKAGASSAFSTVQANVGTFALAGGAALATFGAKAVQAFVDTGKAASDLSDATGLAVEDASRWIAIGDDFEVTADQLQTGIGKIGKTLDATQWKKYGIATRDASGQARDANDILLDAFDTLSRTTNETERAKIGNELFGKGYANLAPLIGHTRSEYEQMLGAVEDGQVITAEEAAQSERTRLALDALNDSVKEVGLAVGQLLSPAVADAADSLVEATDGALELGRALGKIPGMPKGVQLWWNYLSPKAMLVDNTSRLAGKITDLGKSIFGAGGDAKTAAEKTQELSDSYVSVASSAGLARGAAVDGAKEASDAVAEYGDRLTQFHDKVDLATAAIEMKNEADEAAADADDKAAEAAERHAEAVEAVAAAMEKQYDAALNLVGGDIAVREAQRDAADAAEELNDILDDQETSLDQAGAAIDDAAQSQLDAAQAAADYRAKQLEANGEAVTAKVQAQLFKEELEKLVGQLDGPLAAAIQGYIDQLNAIPTTIATTITLNKPGRVGDTLSVNRGGGGFGAEGGIINRPTWMLAGEAGPEALIPLDKMPGNGPLPALGPRSAASYTINLYNTQATPEAVVSAIKKWERLNGPL